jgi:hypothetical protein
VVERLPRKREALSSSHSATKKKMKKEKYKFYITVEMGKLFIGDI